MELDLTTKLRRTTMCLESQVRMDTGSVEKKGEGHVRNQNVKGGR